MHSTSPAFTILKSQRALRLAVWLLGCLAAGAIIVPRANAQLPDLAVTSVYWTGQPVAGQSFVISMVVTNFGPGAASGGWVDEWVLSTSSSVTNAVPNGTLQLANANHSIPANGSYTNTLTWTLSGLPSGQFYVIGVADVFNNLTESDESNNALAVPITLAIPDLAVTSVTFSSQPVVGQPLAVSMIVTNVGAGFANGYWYDELVLSTSTSVADAVPSGTFNFNLYHTVPTNGSYPVNQSITLPNTPVGQYYLIGVADDQDTLEESTYANNALAVPLTLAAPDLAVAGVNWTGQPVAGQNLALTLVETNLGAGFASGGREDLFILSSNATLAGEVPNGQVVFYNGQSLSPNGGYTNGPVNWTLPSVAAGGYYLIGVVNYPLPLYPYYIPGIPESNTNNDTLAVPINLAVPDLAVNSVTSTGQPISGGQLAVSMLVANVGSGFANGNWYDTFVLSTNPTLV